MNAAKLGSLALILFIGSIILVPALLPHIASADCGPSVNSSGCSDHCAYVGDLLRCGGCAVPDYDRTAVRDCDNCMSEFRCDLYRCGWIR